MAKVKPLVQRFVPPVVAAYLLHWGVWALVYEASHLVMSVLTTFLTWLAHQSPAGFPSIEREIWLWRYTVPEALSYGILPIALGLLVGAWVLRRKRNAPQPAAS